MESLIIVVHVIAAIGITGLVLIQHGKGADMGASFGSGASQTIFGSVGSGNALTKSTAWLATAFFATSLVLALFAKQQAAQTIDADGLIENTGLLQELPAQVQQDVPVLPEGAAASDVPQAEPPDAAAIQAADAAAQSLVEQAASPEAVATEAEEAAADLPNAPGDE
jgi:preprotein translocase subunit SecG